MIEKGQPKAQVYLEVSAPQPPPGVVGWVRAPKLSMSLSIKPLTVTLNGNGDFAGVIKLRLLRWEKYFGLPRYALKITCSYKRKTGRSVTSETEAMMWQVQQDVRLLVLQMVERARSQTRQGRQVWKLEKQKSIHCSLHRIHGARPWFQATEPDFGLLDF